MTEILACESVTDELSCSSRYCDYEYVVVMFPGRCKLGMNLEQSEGRLSRYIVFPPCCGVILMRVDRRSAK